MSADPAPPVDERDRVARSRSVLWRRVGDSLVVLPPDADDLVLVGGSSLLLWELLDAPTTVGAAVHRLAEVYDVDARSVLSDVLPVLAELIRLGVVDHEPCRASSPT